MNGWQTELEWRFDSSDVLWVWRPNAEVAEVRFADRAMHFRTTGNDPIIEYTPLLDLQAVAHQAVEIEMKANTAGVAELFWSNTTQSPYGGFLPEKRTDFPVQGDGRWRTYRVFPLWQREGRIIRLRFDPCGMSEFALRAIRIVRLEAETAGEQRAFSFRNTFGTWRTWRGVQATPTAQGIRLQLQEPDGFFATLLSTPAEPFPVIVLRLRSSATRRCQLLFATDQAYGIQQTSIGLNPDGKSHLHNIDMLDSPGWQGRVLVLGIRPGERVGDAVVLEEVLVSSEPQGAPQMRLQFFGVEDALPRAGVPVAVTLRVTNTGGQTARGVTATLRLPTAARVVKRPQASPADLPFGAEAEWRWQVVFARPWKVTFTASISAANMSAVRMATSAEITPRLIQVKSSLVPAPKSVKPKYPVGVYYFPGWRGSGQWLPITRFPERKPVLGWYREGEPVVADWHIKWAVEHGITFFVYDWYWVQGARQLEHALHQGYFGSRHRTHLQFCLLWANHNPPNTSSYEDCLNVTRHWIEQYFHRPEHLLIDGKPVMVIFSPYQLRSDMGSEGVRRAFDAMREECVKSGLKGLYLIACIGGAGEAQIAAREGYDAVTAYNWPHLGMTGDSRWAPFDTLVDGYRQQWKSIVQNSPIPLLPPISGGWDSRPWHGQSALVRYARTPDKFKRHLQDALRLIESHPRNVLPMILIEAWNEWGEGSYIEPHREFGFGYLDAIREVFTTAPRQHADLTPADVGMTVPQVEVALSALPRWDFRQGTHGWDSGMYITEPRIVNGVLSAQTTGDDAAFFGPPVQLPAGRYRRLRLRMRLERAGVPFEDMAQLFWSTRSATESEATSIRFPVRIDGQWHEYTLNLQKNPRWRGVVTRLRLDPCTRSEVNVALALIELLP